MVILFSPHDAHPAGDELLLLSPGEKIGAQISPPIAQRSAYWQAGLLVQAHPRPRASQGPCPRNPLPSQRTGTSGHRTRGRQCGFTGPQNPALLVFGQRHLLQVMSGPRFGGQNPCAWRRRARLDPRRVPLGAAAKSLAQVEREKVEITGSHLQP